MLSRRFDDLLDELLMASAAYHRIPRSPETVPHLARARWYLEAVRSDIAAERELLLATRKPAGRAVARAAARGW